MHNILAFLVAAGQVATAFESQFSYAPRATTSDDNLATVTALSDGHLPTCFTNHPTHPCPTDGPEVKRDAPEVSPGDINSAVRKLPIDPVSMTASSGELALPTDGPEEKRDLPEVSPDKINAAAQKLPVDPLSMTASSGQHALPTEAPAVVVRRQAPIRMSPDYIPDPSEWAIPQDFTFADTISNATATASTTTARLTSSTSKHHQHAASETKTHHSDSYMHNDNNYLRRSDTYVDRLNSKQSDVATPISSTSTSCSGTQQAQSQVTESPATNTSTGLLSGMIGTLLSQPMFPGSMRAPATTGVSRPLSAAADSSRSSAPATTHAPSSASASIIPIPMSQQPDPSASDASLQAFVHPIDTSALADSQQTASSDDGLPSFASPTPLAQASSKTAAEPLLTSSPSGSLSQAPEPSDASESLSRELDLQVNSVVEEEAPASVAQAQPTALTQPSKRAAHAQAHHHPMARRFIS